MHLCYCVFLIIFQQFLVYCFAWRLGGQRVNDLNRVKADKAVQNDYWFRSNGFSWHGTSQNFCISFFSVSVSAVFLGFLLLYNTQTRMKLFMSMLRLVIHKIFLDFLSFLCLHTVSLHTVIMDMTVMAILGSIWLHWTFFSFIWW